MFLARHLLQGYWGNNDFLSFPGLSTVGVLCDELDTGIKDISALKYSVFCGLLSWVCVMTLSDPQKPGPTGMAQLLGRTWRSDISRFGTCTA